MDVYAEGWKRPSTTEPHIGFFFLHKTTKKLPFTLFKVLFYTVILRAQNSAVTNIYF